MSKSDKTITISCFAIKTLIITVIFLISILLLGIIAISTSNIRSPEKSLAYLEGTYRYNRNDSLKPNTVSIVGGNKEWYLVLRADGRCYSNIPLTGGTIGSCYWRRSDRNNDYICLSRPPQRLPLDGRILNNEGEIICAEYGENYINLLGLILLKEER